MVHDWIWKAAGNIQGFLCIGCLEKRLGYYLSPNDFTDAPINGVHPWDTPRLVERKIW